MDLTLLKVLNKASTETFTREANMALGKILIFFLLHESRSGLSWSSHKTLKVGHPHGINQLLIPNVL